MTKIDGFGNRYELVDPKTFDTPKGLVMTHKNNEKGLTGVLLDDWKKWHEVMDSKVEQKEMEL